MLLKNILKLIKRIFTDPLLFYIMIAVILIPAMTFKYFPSMDGPAHLYNAVLIKDLILNSQSPLYQFYTNNPEILNYLHHLILVPLLMIFPAFIAEKILLAIYIIGLPLAFRMLIRTINPKNVMLSWLIFPFIYTFLFILGFYNYSLSFILLFVVIKFYYKRKNTFRLIHIVILFLLMTLLYYAHLFVFLVTCIAFGFLILVEFAIELMEKSIPRQVNFKKSIRKIIVLLIASSIGIVNILLFFFDRTDSSSIQNLEKYRFNELLEWIINIRPVIAYSFGGESGYTTILFLVFFIATIVIFYRRSMDTFKLKLNDTWLIVSIFLMVLYFLSPNFISGIGGHITVRIGIPMFLFFILWLALQEIPMLLKKTTLIITILVTALLINRYIRTIYSLNKDAMKIELASKIIEPYSVVYPINVSDHWLQIHFSNYLGVNKPLVILENYEVSSGLFPIIWNFNNMPRLYLNGDNEREVSLNWPKSNNTKERVVEYIFIWGKNRNEISSINKLEEILVMYYQEIYKSDDEKVTLYMYHMNNKK